MVAALKDRLVWCHTSWLPWVTMADADAVLTSAVHCSAHWSERSERHVAGVDTVEKRAPPLSVWRRVTTWVGDALAMKQSVTATHESAVSVAHAR